MFTRSAELYDTIYASHRDVEREAQRIHTLITEHRQTRGDTLLDVACGTGAHIPYLSQCYRVEGLDLATSMIEIARRRHAGVQFHVADMVDFDLSRQFDAVISLFSSIGYVKTIPRLRQTIENMRRHTRPGGVIIVEPWITPDRYVEGHVNAIFVDEPDLKIARMNVSSVEDGLSILDFHYLVATPNGVEHFTERHELGLFDHEEYVEAFEAAGLTVTYDSEGLTGRGLYIGVREP